MARSNWCAGTSTSATGPCGSTPRTCMAASCFGGSGPAANAPEAEPRAAAERSRASVPSVRSPRVRGRQLCGASVRDKGTPNPYKVLVVKRKNHPHDHVCWDQQRCGCCGVGTVSRRRSAVALMPRCRLARRAAAAPNTYLDSGGTHPEECGGCTRAIRAQAGPDAHSFPRSRPFKAAGSPSERGVPFSAARGAGQTSRSRPRRRSVGGGVCERDTTVSQLDGVAGHAVLTRGRGQ